MGLPVASALSGPAESGSVPESPGPLHGWAMLWTLLGIFLGGVALNLTPCVYPLIPITVSYFGGQSARGGQGKRGDLVTHGICYVGGLAATNSALGVVAALSGGLLGAWLQNPAVLIALAGILLLFATSLFGLWGNCGSYTANTSRFPILPGPLWKPLHGSHARGGRRTMHRSFCFGAAHLGGKHGKPHGWGFSSSSPSAWAWGCPSSSWPSSRVVAEISALGRLDALGAQAHGLGVGGHGCPFRETALAPTLGYRTARHDRPRSGRPSWVAGQEPGQLPVLLLV